MWRISRSNSIIKWQGYRVSAWRLAESYFRYTQEIRSARTRRCGLCVPKIRFYNIGDEGR